MHFFTQSSSSFRNTCPYHHSLFCCNTSWTTKLKFYSQENCHRPDASKDLHAPSGESIPSFVNCAVVLGCMQRLVPPTTAASHCPVRMARSAWSKARRLDEHAVSTAKLGPATNIPQSLSTTWTRHDTIHLVLMAS